MIENLDEAVRFYNKEVLDNEGRITKIYHGVKGPIAKRLEVHGHAYAHTVFFKRSWNNAYGRVFKHEKEDVGQSTKLNVLQEAAINGDQIGIVHPNTDVYMILASDWLSYARKNGTIWTPSTEIQQEASIPKSLLRCIRKDGIHLFYKPGNQMGSISKNNDDGSNDNNTNKDGTSLDGWM